MHLCRLSATIGREEACPEAGCPFWEPGGAALEGRCAIERLELEGRDDVAAWLVRLRARLEAADSGEDAERARRELYSLLDTGDADGG
jgi:hypothetical protein